MLCPQCIGFISSTVPCTRPVSISTQKIETPRQRPPTSYYAYAAKRSGIENTTTNSWRHLHPSPQPHGSDDRIVSDSDGMQNISLHQSNPCPSELFSFGQEVQSIEATLSPSKLRYVPIRNISSRCTPSRKLRCDRCSTRRISSSNDCTISTSRWRDPGTCGECVRRKIPCIGEGSYGCKFHQTAYHCRTIHQESTLISDDNGPSKGPKQKRGRQGGFDDNDDRKKRKATGEIDNVDPRYMEHLTYRIYNVSMALYLTPVQPKMIVSTPLADGVCRWKNSYRKILFIRWKTVLLAIRLEAEPQCTYLKEFATLQERKSRLRSSVLA